MSKYNIVAPSVFFEELADVTYSALKDLGFDVTRTQTELRNDRRNIILGAHRLPDMDAVPSGNIVWNFEPLRAKMQAMGSAHLRLLQRSFVWDYSRKNVCYLKQFQIQARRVRFGYAPCLTRLPEVCGDPDAEDIDVLFYGALNDRRNRALCAVRESGLKIVVIQGVFGQQLWNYIARAKVILNVHYHEDHIFEIARTAFAFANRKAVVSEVQPDTEVDEELLPGLFSASFDKIAEVCESAVQDLSERRRRARIAFEVFCKARASDFIREALHLSVGNCFWSSAASKYQSKSELKVIRVDSGHGSRFVTISEEGHAALDFNSLNCQGVDAEIETYGRRSLQLTAVGDGAHRVILTLPNDGGNHYVVIQFFAISRSWDLLRIRVCERIVSSAVVNFRIPQQRFHDCRHFEVKEQDDGLRVTFVHELKSHNTPITVHLQFLNDDLWPVFPGKGEILNISNLSCCFATADTEPVANIGYAPRYRAKAQVSPELPKQALIFSSWIPESALGIGRYYIDIWKKYHSRTDIYVGINSGSSPEWAHLVRDSGLRVRIKVVEPHLSVDSDVPGYVAALQQLIASECPYEVVWFGHTKGASHASGPGHGHYLLEKLFWAQQDLVQSILCKETRYGIYAYNFFMIPENCAPNIRALRRLVPSPYAPLGLAARMTFFAFRGSIIGEFGRRCHRDFFERNLVTEAGANRWFFELGFGNIAPMFGYEPYLFAPEVEEQIPSVPDRACYMSDVAQNHRVVLRELRYWRCDKYNWQPRFLPFLAAPKDDD